MLILLLINVSINFILPVNDSVFLVAKFVIVSWTNFFTHIHPLKCENSCLLPTTSRHQCGMLLLGIALVNRCSFSTMTGPMQHITNSKSSNGVFVNSFIECDYNFTLANNLLEVLSFI